MKKAIDIVNELEGLISRITVGTGHNSLASSERVTAHKICKLINDLKSDKELDMDIEYIFNRDVAGSFTKDKSYMIKPNGNEFSAIDDEGDIHALSAKFISAYFDKPAPAYTQEMSDNGVLPSVGMECQTSTGIVTIAYKGNKLLIAIDDEGTEFQLSNKGALHALKPLTPPITLIDGKAYQFHIEEVTNIFHAIWSDERQQMCTYHSYFHKRVCEEIQPLTVEVK